MTTVTIDQVRKRAEADARTFGLYLTPDPEHLQMFLKLAPNAPEAPKCKALLQAVR